MAKTRSRHEDFATGEAIGRLIAAGIIARAQGVRYFAPFKFWAFPAGTITPQGYWNTVGSDLAARYHLSERAAAHALALTNMAAYDGIIASHDARFAYWLIRPSQADALIKLAIGLPSFPSCPSNHATVSSAATTVLGALFPSERASLDAPAAEAAISRLYGGIHYRFDLDAGLALGRAIGRYALDHDVVGAAKLSHASGSRR